MKAFGIQIKETEKKRSKLVKANNIYDVEWKNLFLSGPIVIASYATHFNVNQLMYRQITNTQWNTLEIIHAPYD